MIARTYQHLLHVIALILTIRHGSAFGINVVENEHSRFRTGPGPVPEPGGRRSGAHVLCSSPTEDSSSPSATFDGEDVDVCIVGGGVSGLAAALTAADYTRKPLRDAKIILLEGSTSTGGRVQSDKTEDGYILDRGFAVFIEEYPTSKKLFDYEALELGRFLPGALVKLPGSSELAKVADPIRAPSETLDAIMSPVGSLLDKVKLVPLLVTVFTKSVDQLFEEEETDTLTCLKQRYHFSDSFIDQFLKPFFEGIFFCPLEQQSSRMFHFVMKMFSTGSVALPSGGMGAISDQLSAKADEAGVVIRTGKLVTGLRRSEDGMWIVQSMSDSLQQGAGKSIRAKAIILATDGESALNLLSSFSEFQVGRRTKEEERAVGCIYYSFSSAPPVTKPILILSGMGKERGSDIFPINNVCFPSVVNNDYAPEGMHLCSVTVPKEAMDRFEGRDKDLDVAVRTELASWFPEASDEIQKVWKLERIYYIPKAQPAQLSQWGATAHGGRSCDTFIGKKLPEGLFICGDHVATATLNGALESGVAAGEAAVTSILS